MKIRFLIILLILALLSACGKKDKAAPKAKQNDDAQAVMVEELSIRQLNEYITLSGKLEGITDIVMSSESPGRVIQLYKKLGDSVSRGERIGMLENDVAKIRMEQAEASFSAANASFENAQKNLNYAEASKAKNLISEAEYNTAISGFKSAKAGLDGAKAGLEAAKLAYNNTYLLAPESGMIANLNISKGQYINPGSPVASITDASTLIMKTGVGESQIGKLRKGQIAEITYGGKAYTGKIRGFGIRPLTNSANYPVEIELSGKSGLLPGMVVSAKVMTNTYRDLLYTSITNVLKEFDKNYLYVITDQNQAEKREITIGRSIGENVEILSGASLGEKIVTSGSENLEDGSKVTIRQ